MITPMDDIAGYRRSLPVAAVPRHELGGDALAKRWLVQLIASRSLADAATVSAAQVARVGPALCELCVEAIGSDEGLAALAASPEVAAVPALAGARDAPAVAAAVAALQTALWDSARAALREPSAELVAALAERIAAIAAVVLRVSLAGPAASETAVVERAPDLTGRSPADNGTATVGWRPPVVPEPDEELRLSKSDQEPWLAAITGAMSRGGGEPFGVIAIEVDELERLVTSASGKEVAEAIDAAEGAIARELGPDDRLVREHAGRCWVIAAVRTHDSARALGGQLAARVSEAAVVAGAPLVASVGLAMFPADGDDAAALAAHADEALFAARAAGIRIA